MLNPFWIYGMLLFGTASTSNIENLERFQFKFAHVRFEVFTAVTMKNGVFWDVTQFSSGKNRRFGGTCRLLHQGDKNR
jgi:hypothetical protein